MTDASPAVPSPPAHDDWLDPAELATLSAEVLAERTTQLQPLLAAHASAAERMRKPADEVIAAIRRSGVFYHFVPKRYGGLELGVEEFADVVLPLAEACASTAWVTSFCMEHNLILSLFPEACQDEIFGQQPYIIAPGAAFPPGSAEPDGDGFRLTGRWNYASGVMHADWVMAMAFVQGGGFDLRWFLVPIDEVEVHDVWFMEGMAATGSNDVSTTEVYVPAHRTLDVMGMNDGTAPGSTIHDNPIYALPMATFLAYTATLPLIGAARGARNQFRQRIATRVSGGVRQLDRQTLHVLLGEVDAEVHAAELTVRQVARDLYGLAATNDATNVPARAAMRAQLAFATALARDAVRKMVDASGSNVHALDNPMQRALRDISVGNGHVLLDRASASEIDGRSLLGLGQTAMLI